MIVYHGTVDAYLPSIKKGGLKVVPSTRLNGYRENFFGRQYIPLEYGIYVSARKDQADNFALFRAAWLSIPPGMGIETSISPTPLIRDGGPVLHAKPITLTLDLPETLVRKLHHDDRSDDAMEAYWIPATIPPSCIKAITTPKQKVEYYDSPR